jgi:subtilisin-like proprotein convertase family protein
VDLALSSQPAGRTSARFDDGWTKASGDQAALIGGGDPIAYRFDIANNGSGPALNASLVLTGDQVNLGNAAVGDHLWRRTFALGDLAAGATRTVTITGAVDLAAGAARGNLVRLDAVLVFSHSEYAGEPVLSQRSEHAADISPPTHLKLLPGSGLAGRGAQSIAGIVHDAGAVPTITLEVKAPGGATTTVACPGAANDGGWVCGWDAGPNPVNASVFQLRARATDGYGNVSGWTGYTDFIVDTLPVTITLGDATQAALSDGVLSAGERVIGGRLDDNRQAARLDVCDAAGQVCEAATLTLDTPIVAGVFAYDDAPEAPISIDAAQQCGVGTPLLRAFTVPDAFAIANVTLGVNAGLPSRTGLSMTLRSPAGTLVVLHTPGGAAGANLNVRIDDSAGTPLSGDGADHELGGVDYERTGYPDAALSAFDGQNAAGVWTLSLCDATGQSGIYNRARLTLARRRVPANLGAAWSNLLSLPEYQDGVSTTLLLNAYDSLNNRTGPLTVSFMIDDIPPVLTLTAAAASATFTSGTGARTVLTGTVTDGGNLRNVFVTVRTPSGATKTAPTAGWTPGLLRPEAATPWRFDLLPDQSGIYAFSVTAFDAAGNRTTIGPFEVLIDLVIPASAEIRSVFLPMVSRPPPIAGPETPAPALSDPSTRIWGSHE